MFIGNVFIILGILFSLIFSIIFIYQIFKFPSGNEKMNYIAKLIRLGAKAYLNRQYKTIFLVGILISIIIYLFLGFYYTLGFILGSFLSGIVGYIGMFISVYSNVRTANAARISDLSKALTISFRAGSVTGLFVISLSLFGIFFYYNIMKLFGIDIRIILNSLIAFSFGASLISIFARLGGGIFTKAADIGADLVGKIELGIPEDDPRNPAVIADNVGDNVGDCAGMAADLFETYSVTIVASMVIIGIILDNNDLKNLFILYPLSIGGVCIFSTIIGIYFVKLKDNNVMFALYKGFIATSFFSVIFIFFITYHFFGLFINYNINFININGFKLYLCSLIGIFLTGFIILITEYYTSSKFSPVKNIAKASINGHATNIIQGLALSMESTFLPVVFISISIIVSYYFAGIIGIAISASSMLSLCGIIVALDAYGPITDNAGGIAEMSKLDYEVRLKTDILDSVGNTTKAITKGYAIGSAGLASLVLFVTYTEDLKYYFPFLELEFSLKDPFVVIGLFFGGLIPYLFSSFAMKSVGNVGGKVVIEVRRQFKELKILSGVDIPDYAKAIDLLTKESIKEMILPSLLPILFPLFIYFFIFLFFGKEKAFICLGSMLLGIIITGMFVAISMTSGGGAWDNAKKYIENGEFGGKGSDAHKASITGDTVGDPYKDTAGPAINPLIKITNITALLLIMVMSKFF